MKTVHTDQIRATVAALLEDACINLPADVEVALRAARECETQPRARHILEVVLENAAMARRDRVPLCQDTGVTNVFVELGAEVCIVGGLLDDAINDGIREGTRQGYLRCSIVNDPLRRVNTGDNAPGVLVVQPVAGTTLRITVCPKGAGCENMSRVSMLSPADGRDGVTQFVLDTISKGGANPCPPVMVGIGLGGDFAQAPLLAKKALLRTIGARNPDPLYAEYEMELLTAINALGLGPQALGGLTTALDVFIETAPCHIASLPVAVCLNCHATRHTTATL
ncbi:MAG: fumarate hydratase [bacterium]|nr:fumarate hydratase [bacterium]